MITRALKTIPALKDAAPARQTSVVMGQIIAPRTTVSRRRAPMGLVLIYLSAILVYFRVGEQLGVRFAFFFLLDQFITTMLRTKAVPRTAKIKI